MAEHRFVRSMLECASTSLIGKVSSIRPTSIEADGPAVEVGTICTIGTGLDALHAEVVRVDRGRTVLAPYAMTNTVRLGDHVRSTRFGLTVPIGEDYLGCVVDPMGQIIERSETGPLSGHAGAAPVHGSVTSLLDRTSPTIQLPTGIRALDTLLPFAQGQRIGVFAGSGVGKTTLLGGLLRHIDADHCVICLIGERGREADELWREVLPSSMRTRSTMVLATSDQPAALRARAMWTALAHAESLSAKGRHVFLVVDSITRFAMALRELGLAAGEPPTLRAYPPSVFALLPKVVERCGCFRGRGAITAVMTILAESDEIDDPMAETMRSLLDGHIVLSRALAEQGQFPPIDVVRSVSRVVTRVQSKEADVARREAIALLSAYERSRLLIESGAYGAGSNPEIDRAIAARLPLAEFLSQDVRVGVAADEAFAMLQRVLLAVP